MPTKSLLTLAPWMTWQQILAILFVIMHTMSQDMQLLLAFLPTTMMQLIDSVSDPKTVIYEIISNKNASNYWKVDKQWLLAWCDNRWEQSYCLSCIAWNQREVHIWSCHWYWCQIQWQKTMFVERLVIPECKQNMTSLRGQPSWAKMNGT